MVAFYVRNLVTTLFLGGNSAALPALSHYWSRLSPNTVSHHCGSMKLALVLPLVLAAYTTTISVNGGNIYTLQVKPFTDTAFSTSVETSLAHCTARCSRLNDQFCDGVRYGVDGLCELLVGGQHCLNSSDGTASRSTSYRRRTTGPYCDPGWRTFRGSCYYEEKEKKTWTASRINVMLAM